MPDPDCPRCLGRPATQSTGLCSRCDQSQGESDPRLTLTRSEREVVRLQGEVARLRLENERLRGRLWKPAGAPAEGGTR